MQSVGVRSCQLSGARSHAAYDAITKYGTRAAVDRLPWRLLKPDATAQTLSLIVWWKRGEGLCKLYNVLSIAVHIFDLPRPGVFPCPFRVTKN